MKKSKLSRTKIKKYSGIPLAGQLKIQKFMPSDDFSAEKKFKKLNFIVILLLAAIFIPEVKADTVYFKTGRSLEGIILKENGDRLSL